MLKTVRSRKYQKRSFNTHYILCISFFAHLRNFDAAPQIYAILTSSHTHLTAKAGTNHIRIKHPPIGISSQFMKRACFPNIGTDRL